MAASCRFVLYPVVPDHCIRTKSLTQGFLLFSLLIVIMPGIESLTASLTSDQDLASSSSSLPPSSPSSSDPGSTAMDAVENISSRVSMSLHPVTSRPWIQSRRAGGSNYSFPDAPGNFTLTSSSPLILCVYVIVTLFARDPPL